MGDPAGRIAALLARENQYASASSYTNKPASLWTRTRVGDRGRRTAKVCSRSEARWMRPDGSLKFDLVVGLHAGSSQRLFRGLSPNAEAPVGPKDAERAPPRRRRRAFGNELKQQPFQLVDALAGDR